MSTSSNRVGNATWLRYACHMPTFRMPHAYIPHATCLHSACHMPTFRMPHADIQYMDAHAYVGYDNVIRLLALMGR
jgi:hypothetical protein